MIGQYLHHRNPSSIGRAVHGRQPQRVRSIHIRAALQHKLDGFHIIGLAVAEVCAGIQLMPDAAISAVVPCVVAMFGSAPFASNSRITSMSPESAARTNGVSPSKFTQDASNCMNPWTGTVFVLRLGSAPFLSSALITSNGSRPSVGKVAIFIVIKIAQVDGGVESCAVIIVGGIRIGAFREQIVRDPHLSVEQSDDRGVV